MNKGTAMIFKDNLKNENENFEELVVLHWARCKVFLDL